MVPGWLGQAVVLEGSGRGVPNDLGARSRVGAARRPLGTGSPQFVGRRGDRRRRDSMAPRPSLPDAGLPNRRPLPTVAVDRPRAHRSLLAPRPGRAGRGILLLAAVRLQRPLAALSHGIGRKADSAVHILDRFHIMKQLGEAIDKVRATETKRLKRDGYEEVLKHSRWCLLKRPENLTDKQTAKLDELLRYNLQTVRAYLHREDFQRFWHYQSAGWAGRFLDEWCRRVMRSRLDPLKKVVRSLRSHRTLLLNWFRAQGAISSGIVEGFNNKAKLAMRKSYGFREYETIELALYHQLGDLPQPEFTHRFC